jgi:hypothetical protein
MFNLNFIAMKNLSIEKMEVTQGGIKAYETCLMAAGMGMSALFFPPNIILAAVGGLACAVHTAVEANQ